MLQPVIIAGGSGTRLWPLSRQLYPKQFLPLVDDKTMFQATLARLQDLHCAPPIIVCNEDHRFIAACDVAQILRDEVLQGLGFTLAGSGNNMGVLKAPRLGDLERGAEPKQLFQPRAGEIRIDNGAERDFMDIDLLPQNEVQEKVERALKHGRRDVITHI